MKRRPKRPAPAPRPSGRPRPEPPPGPIRGERSGPAPRSRPAAPARPGPSGRVPPRRRPRSPRRSRLAEATVEIALGVERAVLEGRKRADRTLAAGACGSGATWPARPPVHQPGDLRPVPLAGLDRAAGPRRPEERLLIATLLDSPSVHPACRVWARALGRDPSRLIALGDAPTWAARAEGLRRLLEGRPVTADPWRLFPPWLREHLPLPPGGGSAKARFVELLQTLQTRPPLWVRAQEPDAGPLGRAARAGAEALGPPPGDRRGQARPRFRRLPPAGLRARGAGDPGPRLAGRRPGLRPRPRRTLVGLPAPGPAARRSTWPP